MSKKYQQGFLDFWDDDRCMAHNGQGKSIANFVGAANKHVGELLSVEDMMHVADLPYSTASNMLYSLSKRLPKKVTRHKRFRKVQTGGKYMYRIETSICPDDMAHYSAVFPSCVKGGRQIAVKSNEHNTYQKVPVGLAKALAECFVALFGDKQTPTNWRY